jgi:hypothetical protein
MGGVEDEQGEHDGRDFHADEREDQAVNASADVCETGADLGNELGQRGGYNHFQPGSSVGAQTPKRSPTRYASS